MSDDNIQRGFRIQKLLAEIPHNIRIVMVGTTHAGNIGSVARVMKNMGLKRLVLVDAVSSGPDSDAFPMASGSYEIVEQAETYPDLSSALSDSLMVIGTSARLGQKRTSGRTPEELLPEIIESAGKGYVSIVFGRESRGLTNEEMKLCTHHLIIPTDSKFASMNVAQSVAVITYEIFKHISQPKGFQARKFVPAANESREEMYRHIEDILVKAKFADQANPLRIMRDVRRILNSAQLDERDVKIVRGIFRKIGNKVRILEKEIRVLRSELRGGS